MNKLFSILFFTCSFLSYAKFLEILDELSLPAQLRKKAEHFFESKNNSSKTRAGDCITAFQINQQNIPLTITASGNYCLVEDVVINAGFNFAINVNADNVTLDLNGRGINGQRLNNNGVVISGRTNVVVQNGSIINCNGTGVLLTQGCQYPLLEDLLIFRCGNGVVGFGVNSGLFNNLFIPLSVNNSILINNSTISASQNCIIEDCFAVQSDGPGFVLLNCLHCIYQNCIAFGNTGVGFSLSNCREIVYQECISNDNDNHGFQLQGTGFTMQSCLANDNTLDGFRILGGFARISDCQAQSNRNGFSIFSARGLTILGSTAHSNVLSGFVLEANARECELRENTAIINPQFGFQNLNPAPPGSPTGNSFYTNWAKNNGTNFAGIPNFFVSPVPADPINFTTNISN